MGVQNRERDVEKYMVRRIGESGLTVVKFQPDNCPGMPDRLIILNSGRVVWAEIKTDNGRLSELQRYRHKTLEQMGHKVYVLWNKADVDRMAEEITAAEDGSRTAGEGYADSGSKTK